MTQPIHLIAENILKSLKGHPMSPNYNRKLQSALISAGKKVEFNIDKETPTIVDLKTLFYKFIESKDLSEQSKNVQELIGCLLKWQIESL
jgi:hypothetical protein